MDQQTLQSLSTQVVTLAQMVAKKLVEVYLSRDTTFLHLKDNATPLSSADILAHQLIMAGLQAITPDIPVLSEEMDIPPYAVRQQWQQYWLIDPLDGTRGFLNKTGDFSINIALIAGIEPVLGVVAVPIKESCYFAVRDGGAWKHDKTGHTQRIYARHAIPPLTVLISAHHHAPNTKILTEKIAIKECIAMGSAYKICLLAEGAADLYPRFGPTMEWDTAAAHCILHEASGDMFSLNGKPLRYNTQEDLHNPNFIAVGDCEFARDNIFWADIFS